MEHELGVPPRRLVPLDGRTEVIGHRRVVPGDVLGVGQILGPRPVEQVGVLQGAEVLAVDPDQVDTAVGRHSGGRLVEHLIDGVCGVADRHTIQRHAELLGHGVADVVVDVGVDDVVTAPHEPVHRRAARRFEHVVPGFVRRRRLRMGTRSSPFVAPRFSAQANTDNAPSRFHFPRIRVPPSRSTCCITAARSRAILRAGRNAEGSWLVISRVEAPTFADHLGPRLQQQGDRHRPRVCRALTT